MYDVLFIDDHFEEISDTFRTLQKEHIRCFYSDGDKYLPSSDKERLPFKNLKYICLDLHLENRGISSLNNNNAVSTLASVVKSFTENKDICIIINTSYLEDFKKHEKDFCKYLKFTPEIKKEEKTEKNDKKFSSLHDKEIKEDIVKKSHQSVLRNLVIREAIEIENLIWSKILSSDAFKGFNENDISKKLGINNLFKKIQAYNLVVNKEAEEELEELRDTRNQFAHNENPPEGNLLDFLEEIEKLKQKIKIANQGN